MVKVMAVVLKNCTFETYGVARIAGKPMVATRDPTPDCEQRDGAGQDAAEREDEAFAASTLRPRRPFTVMNALGTAAHHTFEVRAGVGLVLEPLIGRRGAVALWATGLPAWAAAALVGEGEAIESGRRSTTAPGSPAGSCTSSSCVELRGGIPSLSRPRA